MTHRFTDRKPVKRDDDKVVLAAIRAEADALKAKVEKLEKPK